MYKVSAETLNQELQTVAHASFYEPVRIGPDQETALPYREETIYWDERDGVQLPDNVLDWSRLMDPAEFFDTAQHIERNLPNAVETIREGGTVEFEYHVVQDMGEDSEPYGWVLLAYEVA